MKQVKKNFRIPFDSETLLKALSILSKPLDEIKDKIKNYLTYDDDLFWLFNSPHILYPLIEQDDSYYCVSPQYLFNQFTSGIYYLADIPNAGLQNEFGRSFEKYVGMILKKANRINSYAITPEIKYGKKKEELKTSDWIIHNDNELIFY